MGIAKHFISGEPTFQVIDGPNRSADQLELLKQYHKLRKQVFVDQLGWDLPVENEFEWDQYDRDETVYVLSIAEHKQVVGGVRMVNCNSEFDHNGCTYSYMLRDATRGIIPGIPDGISRYTPKDSKVWELTRCVSGRNPGHFKSLIFAALEYVQKKGAHSLIYISRPAVYKIGLIWQLKMQMDGKPVIIGNSRWLAGRVLLENEYSSAANFKNHLNRKLALESDQEIDSGVTLEELAKYIEKKADSLDALNNEIIDHLEIF